MNRIPFSVYDFFGYLASGFTLLFACDYAFGQQWIMAESIPPGLATLGIIAAYVVGHAVAHLSSVILEKNFLRKVIRSPEEHLLAEAPPDTLWKWLFPGNFAPLPAKTQTRILTRAANAGLTEDPRAIFLHCHPIVKREGATLERLNVFLNLYGFCRNLSMALILAGAIFLGTVFIESGGSLFTDTEGSLLLAGISFVTAYVLFLRYLKFFRHYTHEVLISYAETSPT